MMQTRSKFKRLITLLMAALVLLGSGWLRTVPLSAAGDTVTTNLVDGSLQRGSKKTFDVIARDSSGKKLSSSVTLNGNIVAQNWDDTDKTSYTLLFTQEGKNIVQVSAGTKTVTYTINYQKAVAGDVIGQAVFSVEAFTIGCGYLVAPVVVDIFEGETSAHMLLRILHSQGYVAYYGGTPEKAFYLAYIGDGTQTGSTYNGYVNSYQKLGAPASPRVLGITPVIPQMLYPHLQTSMDFFDDKDYANWTGYLGEFVFTNGSGWMYSLNNAFPNVGFADSYLSDGDVVRVQFTLGYGADIGGASAMGGTIPGTTNQPTGDFYAVAEKDRLTALLASACASEFSAQPDVLTECDEAEEILARPDAAQSQVDTAYANLNTTMMRYQPANSVPVSVTSVTSAPSAVSVASTVSAASQHSAAASVPASTLSFASTASRSSLPKSSEGIRSVASVSAPSLAISQVSAAASATFPSSQESYSQPAPSASRPMGAVASSSSGAIVVVSYASESTGSTVISVQENSGAESMGTNSTITAPPAKASHTLLWLAVGSGTLLAAVIVWIFIRIKHTKSSI